MVVARINKILVCSSAGAVRWATLVRDQVISAAWGFINVLRSTTVAGVLSWMLSRLVVPLLLLAVRPFVPVILRKYYLWKHWAIGKLEDVVDKICSDEEKLAEKRRECNSWERRYSAQVDKLTEMDKEVARVSLIADDAWSRAQMWPVAEFKNLRPTKFTGRVATAVPETGPFSRLSLWFRLLHWIDSGIHRSEQTIARHAAAMERNQLGITQLENALKTKSKEIRELEDRMLECEDAARTAFLQEHAARHREITRVGRTVTRRREDWDLTEEDTAATTATTSTTLAVVAAPDTALINAAAAEADSPGPAAITAIPPLPARRADPALLPPPPPPPPTAEEIAAAAATAAAHLPEERGEVLVRAAQEQLVAVGV